MLSLIDVNYQIFLKFEVYLCEILLGAFLKLLMKIYLYLQYTCTTYVLKGEIFVFVCNNDVCFT